MQESRIKESVSVGEEYGFDRLDDRVEEALDVIDEMDLDGSYWIKPYTDFDGPVKTRGNGEEQYHDGVKEAFDLLIEDEHILNPGIISGRGTGYLLGQLEELDISEIDVAGEMGAAYFLQDELEEGMPNPFDGSYVVPEEEEDMQDIYSFNLTLFEHLAAHDLQLMYGDNMSNVTGSACVEAYGANLDQDRFSVEDTIYSDIYSGSNAQSVQREIENHMANDNSDMFEFHGDMIRFEKSENAAEVLTDVFIANPFIPWGFHDEGERISIFPEYRAREDFSQKNFEDFVNSVEQDFNRTADTEFWTSTYEDHSFDFGKKGYENLKTQAAETILEKNNLTRQVLMTNTGDKPTDILTTPKSLFFAQKDTEAHRYCQNKDISFIEVENVVESFLIQSELASK